MKLFKISAKQTFEIKCEIHADTEEEAIQRAIKRSCHTPRIEDYIPGQWFIPTSQGKETISELKVDKIIENKKLTTFYKIPSLSEYKKLIDNNED